jgi:adenine-specific DNA methylase
MMKSAGLRPNRLTNAWVPFTVASALALRPGGRIGLVVPAELLQVTYAAELRGFLVDIFEELTAVAFRTLLFDGVLQEVVLLMGTRGDGPAAISVVEVDDAASLPCPASKATRVPHAPALLHDREKWTRYLLPPAEIEALRLASNASGLRRLGDFAEVDVGVVTGRNSFFVLQPGQADQLGLRDQCVALVSKSAHVRGTALTETDFRRLEAEDARCLLLAVSETAALDDNPALRSYVAVGEAGEVNLGYKCSIRRKWWVVPSVWTPDAFLLRQIYDHPRIIANLAGATSTDTIHRVRTLGADPRALAAASINSATFAFAEVLGRSYGGGVLELEPREAEELPFPEPGVMSEAEITRVEELVGAGELLAALELVDQALLIDRGMPVELVVRLRGLWHRLRDRRLARGKGSRRSRARSRLAA